MRGLSAVQVDDVLDEQKSFKTYASQRNHRCQVCPVNNNLRFRRVYCPLRVGAEDTHLPRKTRPTYTTDKLREERIVRLQTFTSR
jgi:hypothetical protein